MQSQSNNIFKYTGELIDLKDPKSNSNCSINIKSAKVKGLSYDPDYEQYWSYIHTYKVVIGAILIKDPNGDNSRDQIVTLRTRRLPLEIERDANFCIEFVGGSVGDEAGAETPEKTIFKEVKEETGLELTHIFPVAKNLAVSGHLTSQTFDFYILYASRDSLKHLMSLYPVKKHDYGFSILRPADNGIIMMLDVINRKDIYDFLSEASLNSGSIAVSTYALLGFLNKDY